MDNFGEFVPKPFPVSKPSITRQTVNDLIDAIFRVYFIKQAAFLIGKTDTLVRQWLNKGKNWLEVNPNVEYETLDDLFDINVYAYTFLSVKLAQARILETLLNFIKTEKNQTLNASHTFILEKSYREEFGNNSEAINEILSKIDLLETKLSAK